MKGSRVSYLNVLVRKPHAGIDGDLNPITMTDILDNNKKSNGEKQFTCFNSLGECSGDRNTIEEVVEIELKDKSHQEKHIQNLLLYQDFFRIYGGGW